MPKILIADDDPANLRFLGEMLKSEFEVYIASDGRTAVDLAVSELPDIILMDVMMPGTDGYTACRKLKADPVTAGIPVIFITARDRTEDIVQGFDAGGQDYLTKPASPQELHARVRTHLELKRTRERYEDTNRLLSAALERMEIMARVDPLTGMANRRYLIERLEQEVARTKRHGKTLCIAMADIDDFKMINDTHGHDCGDLVLRRIAALIAESIRTEDLVARWGGEEFLLVFSDTPAEEARLLADRIRNHIASSPVEYRDSSIKVTVTIGVARYDTAISTDANIKRADDAMYRGKKSTKNCVVTAD